MTTPQDHLGISGKPLETEGILDTYLIRPLGDIVTRCLLNTKVTPNAVSWMSVAAAVGAAVAYFQQTLLGAAIGSILLLVSSALDAADGQLARSRGQTSELGESFDGFCDNLSFGSIYLAATLSLIVHFGISPLLALLLGAIGGMSHSFQSAFVDFERQLFIHFTQGGGRMERDDPVRLRAALRKGWREGEPLLHSVLRWLRCIYCETQQKGLFSSVQLIAAWQARSDAAFRSWFARRYRAAVRILLRAWTLMAPNAHKVGIVICAFLPWLAPEWPLARYGVGLVLGFNLLLNLPFVALIWMQRRIDRQLINEIANFGDGQGMHPPGTGV